MSNLCAEIDRNVCDVRQEICHGITPIKYKIERKDNTPEQKRSNDSGEAFFEKRSSSPFHW